MQILDNISDIKILVVGDVMLDRYWWGHVSRISPEAPVPVVRLERTTLAAGGAANVAVNVAGLGATPYLFGIVGDDDEAELLRRLLEPLRVSSEHLATIPGRPTTVKTRVIAHSQQVVRIDQETDAILDKASESMLSQKLAELISKADAIILSDYAKGLLTESRMVDVITTAGNAEKKRLVDPK